MTAPTEAEIRAVVERELAPNGGLNLAGRLSDAFSTSALDVLYDVDDLRASEEAALNACVYDALQPILERVVTETSPVRPGKRFGRSCQLRPRK
jgi:hypothetical protein